MIIGRILFLLLLAVIVVHHIQMVRQLKKITQALEETHRGNFNIRVRMRTTDRTLLHLGEEINRFLEGFQRMQEKSAQLEEIRKKMITHVSHDLRTPLTSLLGYVEALQKDQSLTEAEREQYLEIISSKAQKISLLTSAFFALAQLESDVKKQTWDVTEMVREVLLSFYYEIEIPEHPIQVWADPSATERILNNLIANALRYGRDGGVLGIAFREESGQVWIDVWDRGKGVAPKDLPFIFERLYTGDTSRNGRMRGNGLGLTITKKLVERQGGEIKVTSSPNEKTFFSFSLLKSQ